MILSQKLLYFSLSLGLLLTACQPWKYQRIAKLPPTLAEASGLYINHDTCWWHNDSGGAATIYATNLKGELLDSVAIPGAKNVDWEELTTDEQGNFYLCDMGNNRNARQDLVIYKWHKGMKTAEQIKFRYPDQKAYPPPQSQWNFDAEGCFWYGDSLYIFSKNRSGEGNYFSKLYALPDQPGEYVATLKDSISFGDRVITGAAINAEGTQIALIAYDYRRDKLWPLKSSLLIIEDFSGRNFLRGTISRQEVPPSKLGRQYETIDYYHDGFLIIASEGSPVTAPFMARLKARKRE
ncbi:MAG: hypothetical protein AAF927_29425 [Bacteroidota bacterium]